MDRFGFSSRIRWDDEVQAFVKYCRPYVRFQTSLRVWFTPFDSSVWSGMFLVFLLISSSTGNPGKNKPLSFFNYVTTWLSSSSYLFSLLLREPIRNFSRGHVTFVALTLLISGVYEGCITTNIIAPAKPFRYENVGQFINSSQKVVVYSANINLPMSLSETNPYFLWN